MSNLARYMLIVLEARSARPQSWTPDFRFIDFPYDKKSLIPHNSLHNTAVSIQSNSQIVANSQTTLD